MRRFHPLTMTLLGVLVATSVQPIVHSHPLSGKSNAAPTLMAKVTFVPRGKGKPQKTSGGASRDSGICPRDQDRPNPYLLPVIPDQEQALTISERPTLLAYVPDTTAKQLYFSITNSEDGRHLYHRYIPISKAGIITVTLPNDAPALEVNQSYQWSMSLICHASLAPDSPLIEGAITRVQLDTDVQSKLEDLSPLAQAHLLGEQGIWYDTIANLAKSRQQFPENATLTQAWETILSTEGLEFMVTQPFLEIEEDRQNT